MNILALIPARGGSKGVPGKNMRKIEGHPLVSYAIEVAKKSKYINKIVVSTDDEKIADIAREYKAQVPFMRPKELAADNVSDFPVIEHAVEWFNNRDDKIDYVVFLRPTHIFRKASDINRAIEKMINSNFDSIRGISKAVYSPYWMKKIRGDKLVSFVENNEYEYCRRQDLPEAYQANGTVEVIKAETILEKKSLYGERIGFVKMGEVAVLDLDTELDFKIVEALFPLWRDALLDNKVSEVVSYE